MLGSSAVMRQSPLSARTGREDKSHDKGGSDKSDAGGKSQKVYCKIQCVSFHIFFTLNYHVWVAVYSRVCVESAWTVISNLAVPASCFMYLPVALSIVQLT